MTLLAKLGFDTTENGPSKIWVTNRGKKRSIFLTRRLPSDSVSIPEVTLQQNTLDAGKTNSYIRGEDQPAAAYSDAFPLPRAHETHEGGRGRPPAVLDGKICK